MHIRAASESDLAVMQDIEWAAGSWFCEVGMPEITEDEPLSLEEFARYQQESAAPGSRRMTPASRLLT